MKRIASSAFLLLMIASATAVAQLVSTTPTIVELSEKGWWVDMKVKNLTSSPARVGARVIFRVLRSDADGNLYLDSAATWDEMARSCAAWLKVSPRELTVPANSWRTLRVEITSPGSLSQGEFWGSLVLTSDGSKGTIASADTTPSFAALYGAPELNVPIVVRKGNVESGLELGEIVALQRGTKGKTPATAPPGDYGTVVLVDARRLGNGAYHGTISALIRRENGPEVATSRRQYSLLWDRRLRLEFPRLTDGSYILELESRAERDDGDLSEAPLSPVIERNVRLVVRGDRIQVMEMDS